MYTHKTDYKLYPKLVTESGIREVYVRGIRLKSIMYEISMACKNRVIDFLVAFLLLGMF